MMMFSILNKEFYYSSVFTFGVRSEGNNRTNGAHNQNPDANRNMFIARLARLEDMAAICDMINVSV